MQRSILSKDGASIGVTASTDPQVDQIRIYRTTDGGSNDPINMQEITGSPFANATTSYNDRLWMRTWDYGRRQDFLLNDPPPPSKLTSGTSYAQGRIWTFQNNTTYFSGFEEIANGVPEECFASGLDGNFYRWSNQVNAHAALPDGIAILTPERIFKVEGDSLDTFRRYTLLEKRGTRSRTAIAVLGSSVAWLDTSNTFWVSDMGEIGLPIRPDLQNIDPAQCYVAIHISGVQHWVTLLDGANGKLFVFDLDRQQWMPPWIVGSSASALMSAEISTGQIVLALARNQTKALKLISGTYSDDGNTYAASVQTNMYRLTPDANPAWKGVLDWVELKGNSVLASNVEQLTDADPTIDPYTSIVASAQPSPDITSSTNLRTTRYNSNTPSAQLLSVTITWPAVNSNFRLYQSDVGLHQIGE